MGDWTPALGHCYCLPAADFKAKEREARRKQLPLQVGPPAW